MKIIKQAAIAALLLVCASAMAQETKYTDKQIPYQQDGAKKELKSLTGLRGLRYMEFFLVGSAPVNGNFMGTCYNTTPFTTAGGTEGARRSIRSACHGLPAKLQHFQIERPGFPTTIKSL
jgi:hypothetical protein